MPAFIKTAQDEALWQRAKEKAKKSGYSEKDKDKFWGVVTTIWKKLQEEVSQVDFNSMLDNIWQGTVSPQEAAQALIEGGNRWEDLTLEQKAERRRNNQTQDKDFYDWWSKVPPEKRREVEQQLSKPKQPDSEYQQKAKASEPKALPVTHTRKKKVSA